MPRSGGDQGRSGNIKPISGRAQQLAQSRAALAGAAVVAVLLAGAVVWHSTASSDRPARADTPPAASRTSKPRKAGPRILTPTDVGRLAAPVQDAAAAIVGSSRAMLLGGLTAADTSTDAVRIVGARSDRGAGRLPLAVHDAAAARLGSSVYLFGGGDGARQHSEIVRVGGGVVGTLPAPSSDQAAAVIGDTAYIVGGFTGTRWLDTIVAWSPGHRARVVAHLPMPVRYAGVAAARGKLVVAGGSLPSGSASSAIFVYSPRDGGLRRAGRLPAPTTHAAAAALGGIAYVIGGRGAALDSPTARVVSVDPRSGRVRRAGHLRQPLSDVSAVSLGSTILLAGGRSAAGTEASLIELSPTPLMRATHRQALDVYAADGPNMLRRRARRALSRVYVPNSGSGTIDVIDPRRFKIVGHFRVGALPQHVT